jgi:hypothetical protein
MTPQLTITVGRAAFAVAGISTAAAGGSAVILATGGAALLVGSGIYLATRNSVLLKTRLANSESKNLTEQPRAPFRVAGLVALARRWRMSLNLQHQIS